MSIKYRPEIDGLRAVAVLAVVLYHAEFALRGDPFSGGFVGVDVFFVISGYLITSIILRESRDRGFSFADFYERRARRILPPLLVVMIAAIPFAWLLMRPDAVKDFAGSVLSSLAFGSNFWFWQEDSYWAAPNALKPFLHTWSLSIEEQFYVVFPVLLLLLNRFARGMTDWVFTAGFVVSLGFAHWLSGLDAVSSFYLLPTRAWELLAGAILAKLELERGRKSGIAISKIAPLLGLMLIVGSVALFDADTRHPSLLTFAPVAGTMMLIWYCRKGEIITCVLSAKPVVAIGLISYSFYLWHFPIFAFARIQDPDPTNLERIAHIALSVTLSVITYFVIEKPARNRKLISLAPFAIATIAAYALVGGAMSYVFLKDGVWGRYTPSQLQILGAGDVGSFADYVTADYDTRKNAAFSDQDPSNDILIIGDSLSQDFYNVLNEAGLLAGKEVSTHYIRARCHNVPASFDATKYIKDADQRSCAREVRIGDPRLNSRISEADFIVVSSNWRLSTTRYMPDLVSAARAETTAPILLIGKKYFGPIDFNTILETSPDDLQSIRQRDEPHLDQLAQIPAETVGNYYDLHAVVCPDPSGCPIVTPAGYLISHDGLHLTREGAQHVGALVRADASFMSHWREAFPDSAD